jgi:hypothetical protein
MLVQDGFFLFDSDQAQISSAAWHKHLKSNKTL